MSIRFAVEGENGYRSALWSVFTMGDSEVGVAMAEAAGRMKVSLHKSGSWQYGYTSEYEKKERAAGRWTGKSRHWKIWKRPKEVKPGYTIALKIVIPPVALAQRPSAKASKPVRWMKGFADRGIVFTVWLGKSSIPPWGYVGSDNVLLGTIPLSSGEFVLIGGHYVSAKDSMHRMMRGLSGFLQVVMAGDTKKLQPFSAGSLLMGFSDEPSGAQVFTEIALHSFTTISAVGVGSGPVGKPVLHSMSDDMMKGLMDIELRIPDEVFHDSGVDPKVDRKAAEEIANRWNAEKVEEMRRLLGIPSV